MLDAHVISDYIIKISMSRLSLYWITAQPRREVPAGKLGRLHCFKHKIILFCTKQRHVTIATCYLKVLRVMFFIVKKRRWRNIIFLWCTYFVCANIFRFVSSSERFNNIKISNIMYPVIRYFLQHKYVYLLIYFLIMLLIMFFIH